MGSAEPRSYKTPTCQTSTRLSVNCSMSLQDERITLSIPSGWRELTDGSEFVDDHGRMNFVIRLARWNIENNGGPFAAAVFDEESEELVSVGVNRVVAENCSLAHCC